MVARKHSMHKDDSSMVSLTFQLMNQNAPQNRVKIALFFIYTIDVFLTAFNIFHRLLVKLGLAKRAEASVPPAFTPTSPPPFSQYPGIHIYCRFVHLYNFLTSYDEELRNRHELFSKQPKNDWIRDWAYWDGIGHGGDWGNPSATTDEDSRSPCSGLNILASHGIIPRSGKKVVASKMVAGLSRAFNISPTMALQLYSPLFPVFAEKGHVFDMEDIGIMNIIEHDASLLRPDYHLADWKQDPQAMSRPHQDLIDRWFPSHVKSTHPHRRRLTDHDFARALSTRRKESKETNPMYSSTVLQTLIGAGSCCLMLNVFGGDVEDLRAMAGSVHEELVGLRSTSSGQQYGYERIPERKGGDHPAEAAGRTDKKGWQPATGDRFFGMTIFEALYTTMKIEMKART